MVTAPGDRAPRVLMIVAQFWPVIGGAETQARRLAAELRRQGASVEVWTGRWNASWPAEEVVDTVPVRRLGSMPDTPVVRIRRWIFTAALLRALMREGRRFDVIHVHQVLYPAFVASLAAWRLGRPCIARISSTGPTSDFRMAARGGLGVQRALTRRLLTRVVAVSARSEADCRAAGYRPEQVVRIPNGILVPDTAPPREARTGAHVVYVGGLRPEKRVEDLLRAWLAAGQPGRLTIVGDGGERKRLEAIAAPARGTVEFLGEVVDPTAWVRSADVFVIASSGEGMSNALLEAMAAGCACVATFVGGNVDLLGPELAGSPPPGRYLRGSAGLLVPPGDVDALACALRDLSRDAEVRAALGAAGHRRCREGFAIADVTRAYLALYRSLAGGRG